MLDLLLALDDDHRPVADKGVIHANVALLLGEAEWWGKELFGIDNALVGNWPVVVIKDGKARIQQYKSIPAWWAKNKDLMIKHMTALNQMYFQRK